MTPTPKIILSSTIHKDQEIVCLKFDYNSSLQTTVKDLKGRRWSNTHRSWYVETRAGLLDEILALFKGKAQVDASLYRSVAVTDTLPPPCKSDELAPLSAEHKEHREELIRWMRSRRYSDNTIHTYSEALSIFLRYFSHKQVEDIIAEDLVHFNNDYLLRHQLSSSYQNQMVNAVKLFFRILQKNLLN